jgi:hypothetical protein
MIKVIILFWRLRSGSHAPTPESPNYRRIFEELKALFDQHQQEDLKMTKPEEIKSRPKMSVYTQSDWVFGI